MSNSARKAMSTVIRGWRLGRCTGMTFHEVAAMVNRVVAGSINYYERLYKSLLIRC